MHPTYASVAMCAIIPTHPFTYPHNSSHLSNHSLYAGLPYRNDCSCGGMTSTHSDSCCKADINACTADDSTQGSESFLPYIEEKRGRVFYPILKRRGEHWEKRKMGDMGQ